MKIIIVDKFEAWGVEQLKGLASELAIETELKGDALKDRIAAFDPDVLVVRSTKIPESIITACKKLLLIVRAGSGVDNIDMPAASKRGIMVSNCPGMNAASVAELTIGLMVSIDRRIADNVADLRQRKWGKIKYSKAGYGFKGRTLGIIGAGAIGTEVARKALAFDMNVLYYHLGRQRRLADNPNCRRAELDELLKTSDVVTIHVPGGGSTKNLIDERRLAMMKKTALLINTSRGDVIDEPAMLKALKEGKLRGAAVDVFHNEPAANAETFDTPCADVLNLYGTHHIGASTEQAQMAVAEETVRIVTHYMQTGQAINCVNMQKPRTGCMMVVRFHNKPGGLAHVFNEIAEAGINAEEMDHLVYDGGVAAVAHIRIDKEPSKDVVERIRTGHPNVIGVDVMNVD